MAPIGKIYKSKDLHQTKMFQNLINQPWLRRFSSEKFVGTLQTNGGAEECPAIDAHSHISTSNLGNPLHIRT